MSTPPGDGYRMQQNVMTRQVSYQYSKPKKKKREGQDYLQTKRSMLRTIAPEQSKRKEKLERES
jgi:hypothetical protein